MDAEWAAAFQRNQGAELEIPHHGELLGKLAKKCQDLKFSRVTSQRAPRRRGLGGSKRKVRPW